MSNSGAKKLIKVKSCNTLLRVPLVCVRSYLKLVLSYRFLILDTYHPGILYLREQGCEDPWLFFEAKRGSASNKVSGNTELDDTPCSNFTAEVAVSPQPCGMSRRKRTFLFGNNCWNYSMWVAFSLRVTFHFPNETWDITKIYIKYEITMYKNVGSCWMLSFCVLFC
jgi:hypothetical protein